MSKISMGAKSFLYPMTMTLIGANVDNKPNYMSVGWNTIINDYPPIFLFSTSRSRHTVKGILESGKFSVNIPNTKLAKLTDYMGIHSGSKVDKDKFFTNFYGKLESVPMIKECPVNLECKLIKTVKFSKEHELFIGEIIETHVDKDCITNNLPDPKKVDPILITPKDNHYWSIGNIIGKAWSIGKEI